PRARALPGRVRGLGGSTEDTGGHGAGDGARRAARAAHLRAEMADLLALSADEDRAREHLYGLLLHRLAPDEARILAVLADGTPFAVLDVHERSPLRRTGRVLLRNASTVGHAAGVSLPGHVPGYVTRLAALGLVEIDGEDPALDTQYEVLLTDETVVEALAGRTRAGFDRRTLRLSALGRRFWAACDPHGA
uniref:Abi-alpha family protein n=1 Tax=Saccharomonospora saliphila TaxID=369829 RepID=UPI00036113B0